MYRMNKPTLYLLLFNLIVCSSSIFPMRITVPSPVSIAGQEAPYQITPDSIARSFQLASPVSDHNNGQEQDSEYESDVDIEQQAKEKEYEKALDTIAHIHNHQMPGKKRRPYFKKLEKLVRQGVSPNHITPINGSFFTNFTALIACAENSSRSTLRKLLYCGADPNIQDSAGNSALHCAAKGDLEGAEQLLKAQALILLKNRIEQTPLFYAAHNKQCPSMAKLFLFILMTETHHMNGHDINKQQLKWDQLEALQLEITTYQASHAAQPSQFPELCSKPQLEKLHLQIQKTFARNFQDLKIYKAIETVRETITDADNPSMEPLFLAPHTVYAQITDDSGEIVTAPSASSAAASSSSAATPNEGPLFRSIAYARNGIHENIHLFLQHRQIGMNKGPHGIIRKRW